MLAPGIVDVERSTLGLPLSGLATCVHSVPFQFMVRVCVCVVPEGVYAPTAHTSLAVRGARSSLFTCVCPAAQAPVALAALTPASRPFSPVRNGDSS
jgi:hypothetical protein